MNENIYEKFEALQAEVAELRAFIVRTAGMSIVSTDALTPTEIAVARAADRTIVLSDGRGFVAKSQEAAHLSLMQTTTAYYEAEVARLTEERDAERERSRRAAKKRQLKGAATKRARARARSRAAAKLSDLAAEIDRLTVRVAGAIALIGAVTAGEFAASCADIERDTRDGGHGLFDHDGLVIDWARAQKNWLAGGKS